MQEEGVAEQGNDHLYKDIVGQGKTYHRSERMWDRHPVFKAVTVHPRLLQAVGQCVGEYFLPMNDSFVCKIPRGNVPVGWHQDPPYGAKDGPVSTHAIPNFIADIYLDDSTVENGCVWGMPGNHLVGHVDLTSMSQEELFQHSAAIPIEMEAGDVLFHAISAPHGSVGNTTDTCRRIFYVHFTACEIFETFYSQWADRPGRAGYQGSAAARGNHA